MRVTRAKQYRRHLRFFRIVYGISAPYKVILDGNFIHGCISAKVDIQQRLASVLQGASLQLYVPRAAREELKALGPDFEAAYKFAMGYCRGLPLPANGDPEGEDGETPEADPAREILATVGPDNAAKYLVASQDEKLRVKLRRVPGCPLVFVSRTVLVMEQPSGKTKADFEKSERKKGVGTTEEEDKVLQILKRRDREDREKERESQPRKRLKKKASAPNPLSCRRAKGGGGGAGGSGGGGPGTKASKGAKSAGAGAGAAGGDSTKGGSRSRKKRKKSGGGGGGVDGGGGGGGGERAST